MSEVRVVIVGAGLAGIATAIALKDKLAFTHFTIYEKADDVGGTWRDNVYPGCACDVPVHWYSLSTELNPDWTTCYADQPEILDYWRAVARKHDLYGKIQFNSTVDGLTWNEEGQYWRVEITHGDTQHSVDAEMVFSAAGGYARPNYAAIKGMDAFQGPLFHSARWDYGVDLRGKTVGVIGNGCSAAQFIPKISQDPSVKVINFCRTPNWIVPRRQYAYSNIAKFLFRYVPLFARLYRNIIVIRSDYIFILFKKRWARFRGLAEKMTLRYMRKMAPKKYHLVLTPNYAMGCKRIILDSDYYASLHRPNVELVYGGVREITKDGIITGTGDAYACDVIIASTGFLLVNPDLHVRGRNNLDLYAYFESRGGPEAFKGTSVPGFPNLFLLLGPNVASGHLSVIFSEEMQILYALQLIKPILEKKARSFEVRKETSEQFNVDLQARLSETTWSTCASFYRDANGKIIATFPGSLFQQWHLLRRVDWNDYTGMDADAWWAELARRRARKVTAAVLGLGFVVGLAAMFTVLGAIAAVGGAIPLIKKSTEGQDESGAAARPAPLPADPIAAVLQAAKTLSQSLPSGLTGHALSKATNPPSFLVPSHTPSPPVSDLQVLAAVLTAARKHGLQAWGCQSIFVRGLDVGIWVGPIDAGDDDVAGAVVDRLTGGKAGDHVQATTRAVPAGAQADPAFAKAVQALDAVTVFALPEKDGKQAFFLAGRNPQTNNWLAIAGASGSEPQSTEETKNEPTEAAAETQNASTEAATETKNASTETKPEDKAKGRRKGRKRRKRQKNPVVKHGVLSDAHEQGSKDIKNQYDVI